MRGPSGTLHVVDFQTNQIIAAIQPKDYWDDKRHWEIKNNIDTLEFKVFDKTKNAISLMQQNLVLKEVRDGRIVPYVITEVETDSEDRSLTAYASGEWIQLAKAGWIPPQKLEGKTVIEMMDIALAGTKWKRGKTMYSSFRSMTIDEFIDPLSLLKKIASLFDLEIQYRAEVVGPKIVSRYVDMVEKRGNDTGKEVTLGKDLIGIKRIENSQNICTALLGFVKKEGKDFITIADVNNGVPYLVDNDAFQRWNEDGKHKFGFYSPETENDDMDSKRLLTLMKTEMKKRINTSVSYEVSAHSIGRIFDLSHELINEGDTIRIKDTGFTPKLYLIARAISGDESFTDPSKDKYIFGDYREIVDTREELQKLYNKLRDSLYDKADMDALKLLEKQVEDTSSGFNERLIAMKTSLEQTDESIRLNAQAVNQKMEKLSSTLDVNAREIKAKVGKGDIASELNITPQSVLINSELIDLVGKVKAEWLTAGLLMGMTIKTSNEKEYIHMQNQVLKFVNQGVPKMIMGFENEFNSKTLNPYIVLGQGDGTGRNVGTIYKDGNGVYYRFVDLNGLESSVRLTAQGNVGMTAQTNMWLNANNSLVLDGGHGVSMNHAGKTVADFIQVNGVNFDLLLGGNHRIRSSTAAGYDKLLQIMNSSGNAFRGIEVAEVTAHGGIRSDTNLWAEQNSYAIEHINRSTERIKTAIHELPFSALEKILGLKVKKYYLKKDMYDLYQMRMNKPPDRTTPYTTKDIPAYYGVVAEETDDIFTTPEKDGVRQYTTLILTAASVQELYDKFVTFLEEYAKKEKEKEEENEQLKKRVVTLENEVSEMKALLQKLIS
ncbi:phage tail protein [Bacillus cereus group sp. Bcc02]|uniref:phage tail spike protein n=1 Tax=Bacillus cereus group sp. Bcc02 TaxID=3018101 RepID=UPI0009B536A6|nr:phage tail spike protein [Bacillus cereus group sp. Bcc02]MDA2034557.1 phage tail protein [Bacillus cereus group sp. Bcc02]HDR7932360.1 phage tail protein [Bacillus pacificus]